MQRRFKPEILGHPLRREILATKIANRLVNRLGMVNPFELAEGDALARRASDGTGLTRPELAVLLSSVKLVLQASIEDSTLAADPLLEDTLLAAFPEPMRGPFREQILGHRLRTEIIATKLANRMVNRLGVVHPFELAEEEGAGLASVAGVFVAAERLFDAPALWADLETAEMPETARLMLFDRLAAALRSQMADLLRAGGDACRPSELIADLASGVDDLDTATDRLLAPESRHQSARLQAQFVEAGAPEELAAKVAHMFDLDGVVGLADLARISGIAPRALTAAFTQLGDRLGLDWAQGTAKLMNPSDVWERLLVAGLARDFQQMRLDFLRRLSRGKEGNADPSAAVDTWAEKHRDEIRQFRAMIGRAQSESPVAPAVLAQIASQARNLLGR
jgi:glutamate dehydrogenase